MKARRLADLVHDGLETRQTRRSVLRRSAALGLSVPLVTTLLAACGESDDDDPTEVVETPPAASGEPTAVEESTPSDAADEDEPEPTPEDEPEPTPEDEEPIAGSGGIVRVGSAASPTSMLLQFQPNWPTFQMVRHLYDSILRTDENEELQPWLAESWEISDDGLEYTFTLREDVSFHDGTPFNAEALKYNIDWQLEDADTRGNQFLTQYLDSVEIVDDYTVHFTLKELAVFFGIWIAGWDARQVSPTAHQSLGTAQFALQPVGTGPFKFVAYEPDSHLELERFNDYWGGAPALDGLLLRVIPEPSVHTVEIQSGTLDVSYSIPIEDVSFVEDLGAVVEREVAPGVAFISLNVARGHTAELAVRKAIAHSIDRDTIIEETLYGLAEKSRSGLPSASPYYREDVPAPVYDPEEAGRILDEAGWVMGPDNVRVRDGEPLRLHMLSTEFGTYGFYNQILQEQLRQVGIDSEIELYEWGAYLDKWRAEGDYEITYHAQGGATFAEFVGGAIQPDAYWHIHHLRDSTDPELMEVAEQLTELFDSFAQTLEVEARSDILAEAHRLIQDYQMTVYLWHTESWAVAQSSLKDYRYVLRGFEFDKARLET